MSKTILLVEDNPDDELLTLRAFKKANIVNELTVARDGVEAVERLLGKDASDPPALVLLDLKLPKIDGLEVLRRLRADPRTRLVPVVVLTTSTDDPDLKRAYELGCNSYIRKPVDFSHFVSAVGTVGLYWLILNEAPR